MTLDTAATPRSGGELSGETVVYSPVLRVGRLHENGAVKARVRVEGRPIDINVINDLVEHVWGAAKTGEIMPLRLRGKWVEADDGELHLERAELIGIDATFVRWTGYQLLEDIKQYSSLFSSDDFERMLAELEAPTRED